MKSIGKCLFSLVVVAGFMTTTTTGLSAQEIYQSPRDFLSEMFDDNIPLMRSLDAVTVTQNTRRLIAYFCIDDERSHERNIVVEHFAQEISR